MASFQMNIGSLDHCPPPAKVVEAMKEFGLPDGGEFGVLSHVGNDSIVQAIVIRRDRKVLKTLDGETHEVAETPVDCVVQIPVGLFPRRSRIETYDGGVTGIELMGAFLGSALALPAVVNPLELDVLAMVRRIMETTERFQLRSARLREYAANSYVSGSYAPKFLDTQSGLDFLEEHAEYVDNAVVRFQAPGGRATVTVSPKACFRFSVANEDDKPAVQQLLRKLA